MTTRFPTATSLLRYRRTCGAKNYHGVLTCTRKPEKNSHFVTPRGNVETVTVTGPYARIEPTRETLHCCRTVMTRRRYDLFVRFVRRKITIHNSGFLSSDIRRRHTTSETVRYLYLFFPPPLTHGRVQTRRQSSAAAHFSFLRSLVLNERCPNARAVVSSPPFPWNDAREQ